MTTRLSSLYTITSTATCVAVLFLVLLLVGEGVHADSWSGGADENCLPHQNTFLKEILLGRCYEQPPNSGDDASSCPSAVGSFMGIIEGRLDAELEPHDFDAFANSVDLGLGKDQNAVIFLPFSFQWCRAENPFLPLIQSSTAYASVETTPGGALLDGLIFCGNGVAPQKSCSPQTSRAGSIFWKDVAYPAFAKSIRGKLAVVMLSDSERNEQDSNDSSSMNDALLSNVDWTQVTQISFYAETCDVDGAATNMMERWKKEILNGSHIPISCSSMGSFVTTITGISIGETEAEKTSTEEAQPETSNMSKETSNSISPSPSGRQCPFRFVVIALILAVALIGYRVLKFKQQQGSVNGKYNPVPEIVAWS